METNIWVSTLRIVSKGMGNTFGRMDQFILASLNRTVVMV
mgnify:CR=1 FL=1